MTQRYRFIAIVAPGSRSLCIGSVGTTLGRS